MILGEVNEKTYLPKVLNILLKYKFVFIENTSCVKEYIGIVEKTITIVELNGHNP